MQSYLPYYSFGNDYNYGSSYGNYAENILSVFLVMCFILTIPTLISVVKYILMSIGLYRIASRRNIKNAFLAFVPVANSYLIGFVYDDINKTMNNTTKTATKLLVLRIVTLCVTIVMLPFTIISSFIVGLSGVAMVITVIASLIGAVAFVISVIYYVYYFISVYGIYKEYAHDKALLFLVLSIICLPLTSLLIFLIRYNQSGFELWQKQREQQFNVTETKFEEEVTESAVEEVFSDVPTEEEQDQTIIENDEQSINADFNE